MSDKLKQDFDIYYKELENFTGHFKTASQGISTDPNLSKAGKPASLAELQKSHEKDLAGLGERLKGDFGKRVLDIDDFVAGKKKSAVLDSIKTRFSKGESLSGDETNRLLLHEMTENKTIMRKSNFQGMLVSADEKQIRKTSQALSDSKDIERLGWLKELADLRGDSVLSSSLQGQIGAVRDSTLSDEQKNLKGISERIEKGLKLFTYSIEKSKAGTFMDVRQPEEIIDTSD